MKNQLVLAVGCILLSAVAITKSVQTRASEKLFLNTLQQYVPMNNSTLELLSSQAKIVIPNQIEMQKKNTSLPLFTCHPVLGKKLAYISLGTFPTPVEQLENVGKELNVTHLYIKRDDLSGGKGRGGNVLFGGNKIRKLEFLFGDVQRHGANSVLTFGCAGSNHVVATAAYAKQLGLRCIAPLTPQPNSHIVRRNLLLMHYYDAELSWSENTIERNRETILSFLKNKKINGDFPYFIPTGGSCPIGIVGYVNAAFELKDQINQGMLPKPDRIYVPAGSFGTVAGLLLGLKAAQIQTKLIAICVEPEDQQGFVANEIKRLFAETNQLLHTLDSSFLLFDFDAEDMTILYDFSGEEYGLFTQEGANAIEYMKKYEGIRLEGTYSGKAFAALMQDTKKYQDQVILFWNTFCSDSFDEVIKRSSYLLLPKEFHRYFKEDVQFLDK